MAAIDQIINVNISVSAQAVAQASFAIPLIIGPTVPTSGIVNTYFAASGMLTNGYTVDSPEYIYALELFEQALSPTEFMVGVRQTAVAQVDTFQVNTVTSGHVYSFDLNGILISYTALSADTFALILAGLQADIATQFPTSPPVNSSISGSGGSSLLNLTSSTPGQTVLYGTIDSLLTHATPTANYGIQTDINAIIAVSNGWYGMALCEGTDGDIEQASALIESLKKIYISISATSAIATSSSTDILSILKGKSVKRTALVYSPANIVAGFEAAWLGGQLPAVPGSNNWAFKNLVGMLPDNLSANQQAILIGDPVAGTPGKNGNIYQTVGGVNITEMGTMAGGQYIDITVGVDWLESTIQTNVFSNVVNLPKIPYTDIGTGIIISAVKAAIDQGVTNGFIDGASPISITATPVAQVPTNQRAMRIAPTVSFSCRLAGAYNAFVINGTVSV